MTLDPRLFDLLKPALERLAAGFAPLGALPLPADGGRIQAILEETATRLHDNDPYHHPLYAGQMLKPPHPIARLAYALAMGLNPNNHALDGGRASSAMEKEVVQAHAELFGWRQHLGHLTGGGTLANFEALWVARELAPGQAIAASALAHYTHERLSAVLGVPCVKVPVDGSGRMDLGALERLTREGQISTIVATLGTTAFGTTDPLPEILALARHRKIRVHVDAAYGGYFHLASLLDSKARRAFDALAEVDSLVVDPHKHGLQPYGCGLVLFQDPSVGRFYRHDSPYTYFSSDELHLGEISLECSRAGASAVALWATQRLLPYVRGGEFARSLDACLRAARSMHGALAAHPRFAPILPPELDIVVFALQDELSSRASERARRLFHTARKMDLHLALAEVPSELAARALPGMRFDREKVTALRSCLMKPDHEAALPEILRRLEAARAASDGG